MTEIVKECWSTPSEERGLDIDIKSVRLDRDLEHHSVGTISLPTTGTHRNVLIEWLCYGSWVLPATEAAQRAQRVKAVAQLLNSIPHPPSFRLLRCTNFFHDSDRSRFGLIFEFPFPAQISSELSKVPSVVALSELLARSLNNQKLKRPSLGERFRLAQILASAISDFHKVGWLHRNISPHNVVFPQVDGSPDYENPYIIGFSHSRRDHPNEFTEGPGQKRRNYHHPEYIQRLERYRAEFDLYSLGIVLLEIAHWHLLDHLTRGEACQRIDDAEFRLALIKEAESGRLAHKIGSQYCQAIKACLTGRAALEDQEEVSSGSNDAAWLQHLFQQRVVDELAKCSA